MGWVDVLLLTVMVLSVLVGVLRGLLFELMSLMGWLVAYLAAVWAGPLIAPHLPIGQPGSAVNHAAALAALFFGVLVVWAVLARVLRLLLHSSPLSLGDRALGALFGGLRGLLLLLVLTQVVGMTPLYESQAWRDSIAAPWLMSAVALIKPLLPSKISQYLPA